MGDDGVTGDELWKTDGTAAGTVMVKDITLGNSSNEPEGLKAVAGILFFYIDTNTGTEIWKSDGTEAGTVMLKAFSDNPFYSSNPFKSFNGQCYFTVDLGTNNPENGIWKSDGTEAGTQKISFIQAINNSVLLAATESALFYSAPTSETITTRALWKTDGTAVGTTVITGANNTNNGILSGVSSFGVYKNVFYFSSSEIPAGATAFYGEEFWKCGADETTATFVANIASGNASSFPQYFTGVGDILFFSATTPTYENELYKFSTIPVASISFTWTGAISTEWENAGNWSSNQAPINTSAVVIPADRPRYPIINITTTVKSISTAPNTSVNVAAGVTLFITGN